MNSLSAWIARSMMPSAARLGGSPSGEAKPLSIASQKRVAPDSPTMRSAPLTWCRCAGQGSSSSASPEPVE